MSAPYIVSAVHDTNQYMLVTFSEPVYGSVAANTDIELSDFLEVISNDSKCTSVVMLSIKKADGSTINPAGGDTVYRFNWNFVTAPEGDGTIEVYVDSNKVWNAAGEAMVSGTGNGSGDVPLNPLLTVYCSKDGDNTNDGLSPSTSKLTLTSTESILQPGYNVVHIGIGEYIDTTGWDTLDTQIEVYGDYDGSVFETSAGEVKHTTANDFYFDSMTRMDRMTIKLNSSGEYFLRLRRAEYSVFNTVVFEAYSGGSNFFSSTYCKRITLNDCSLITGKILVGTKSQNYTTLIFNNWDNITSGKPIVFQYSCPLYMRFNNSSVLVDSTVISAATPEWEFIDCTIKMFDAMTVLVSSQTQTQLHQKRSRRSVLFKDCDILDDTGADLNLNAGGYVNYQGSDSGVRYSSTSSYTIAVQYYENTSLTVLFDNINSDGKKTIMYPIGITLNEEATQHNSKNVLYFYTIAPSQVTPMIIKLNGLSPSTEYTVTWDFIKAINSVDAIYDMRYGILTGNKRMWFDLMNAPENAEDYIDVVAADHTYDTWYDDKTLTFTTSAFAEELYFLAFYVVSGGHQFKITQPVVTVVA